MLRRFAVVFAALMVAAPAFALDLKIRNNSDYDIHELYMSAAHAKKWGPDQLGDELIEAGDTFTLQKIDEGDYDLKLVDEDGTECVLENVEFDDDKVWTVTNKMLERCDSFGR